MKLNINIGEEIENLRRASGRRKDQLDALRRDASTAEKRRQLSSLKKELGEYDDEEPEDQEDSDETDQDPERELRRLEVSLQTDRKMMELLRKIQSEGMSAVRRMVAEDILRDDGEGDLRFSGIYAGEV